MKTAYPIVLTSTEEGYTAYIPDFNLTAKGEQQSDAISAAKNAICMWAFSEEKAEKSIPKPFSTNGIAAKSGQIVTLVDVSLEEQQRMVQKSIAIFFAGTSGRAQGKIARLTIIAQETAR